MTCSCPKCTAHIEFAPTEITSEGLFNKCSECGTSFAINKESFAKRALHKSGDIYCAECGGRPGPSIYCQSCHAIYPDFLVIETSSATKRQIGKIVASLNVLKNLKLGGSTKVYSDSYAADHLKQGKTTPFNLPGKPAQLLVTLAVILCLGTSGGYYWYKNKQEAKYSESYVKALLLVKMGRDFDIQISSRLANDLKSGASSSLTAAELKSAAAGKNDADTLMKRIDKTPKKFTASNESLIKLYETYSLLHATVTSPPGSSEIYSGSVKKIDEDFRKSARELKSGLPERISDQLAESSKRFKQLQDL